MSYESIAELVHNIVKNPKNLLEHTNGHFSSDSRTKELVLVQNVFTKYEVNGDTLKIESVPLVGWD